MCQASAQSSSVVSNVQFSQRTDGSGIVDINYNVSNSAGSDVFIIVKASNDNGQTWDYPISQISGNIGTVSPGYNKQIVWNFGAEHPNIFGENFRIKVIASSALFYDDFNNAPINSNWTIQSGSWSIVNQELNGYWSWNYAQTDQGKIMLNESLYDPEDYVVSTQVKVRTGYQVGGERFVLRNSSNNQIMVSFDWNTKSVYPHVRINGAYYFSINTVTNLSYFNNTIGSYNEYSLKKTGNYIEVYVNGHLATQFYDTYFNGNTKFGLATYGNAYYNNFWISNIE
jgi:hypothetical protein